MPTSMIDSSKPFSTGEYVISLVQNGEHAVILIEEIYNGNHEITKIDFKPYKKNYYICYGADPGQLFFNKALLGSVNKLKPNQNFTSRDNIFNYFHLVKYKGVSWIVKASDAETMMDKVNFEIKGPESSPSFNIKGKYNNAGCAHNCCTWAIERLKMISALKNDLDKYVASGTVAFYLNLPELPASKSYTLKQ